MSNERPILVVEDDEVLRSMLVEYLSTDGEFAMVGAATLEEASRCLEADDARFDAVILDVGLPDGNGVDFCAKLRRLEHRMPIIMLTGLDATDDVVRGLEAGANDYISKPFRSRELLARIHAQLRIFENSEHAVFDIGPYTFRPGARLLLHPAHNSRIRLTDIEARILKRLYRAGRHPVARKALLSEIWGYHNPGMHTHTLETHIYRLRQKMDPSLVVTEGNGSGYRLNP